MEVWSDSNLAKGRYVWGPLSADACPSHEEGMPLALNVLGIGRVNVVKLLVINKQQIF